MKRGWEPAALRAGSGAKTRVGTSSGGFRLPAQQVSGRARSGRCRRMKILYGDGFEPDGSEQTTVSAPGIERQVSALNASCDLAGRYRPNEFEIRWSGVGPGFAKLGGSMTERPSGTSVGPEHPG